MSDQNRSDSACFRCDKTVAETCMVNGLTCCVPCFDAISFVSDDRVEFDDEPIGTPISPKNRHFAMAPLTAIDIDEIASKIDYEALAKAMIKAQRGGASDV